MKCKKLLIMACLVLLTQENIMPAAFDDRTSVAAEIVSWGHILPANALNPEKTDEEITSTIEFIEGYIGSLFDFADRRGDIFVRDLTRRIQIDIDRAIERHNPPRQTLIEIRDLLDIFHNRIQAEARRQNELRETREQAAQSAENDRRREAEEKATAEKAAEQEKIARMTPEEKEADVRRMREVLRAAEERAAASEALRITEARAAAASEALRAAEERAAARIERGDFLSEFTRGPRPYRQPEHVFDPDISDATIATAINNFSTYFTRLNEEAGRRGDIFVRDLIRELQLAANNIRDRTPREILAERTNLYNRFFDRLYEEEDRRQRELRETRDQAAQSAENDRHREAEEKAAAEKVAAGSAAEKH